MNEIKNKDLKGCYCATKTKTLSKNTANSELFD